LREVIELIGKWRSLHQGFICKRTNKIVSYSLAQAAKLLQVSRKSLDDYFLALRRAKMHGFDFSSHLDEKFGVVRTFLRNLKAENESGQK